MKTHIRSALFVCAMLLAACGISPEQTTATAVAAIAQTQTAIPTLTPTATFTPTATRTATATPTPTFTPTPTVPPYSRLRGMYPAEFTPVLTDADANAIMADIMSNPKLRLNASSKLVIDKANIQGNVGTGQNINQKIGCKYNVSCVIRASISRPTPFGDNLIFVWEATTASGRIFFQTSIALSKPLQEDPFAAYKHVIAMIRGEWVTLLIVTKFSKLDYPNPLIYDMTNNAPYQDALRTLEQGNIPADLSKITLLLWFEVSNAGTITPQPTNAPAVTRSPSNTPGTTPTEVQPPLGAVLLSPPVLLMPIDGDLLDFFPRNLTLLWQPVPGATKYRVEVELQGLGGRDRYGLPIPSGWYPHKRFPNMDSNIAIPEVTNPWFTFNFVGANPGRWRVWAVDAHGISGIKSDWWYFRYLH